MPNQSIELEKAAEAKHIKLKYITISIIFLILNYLLQKIKQIQKGNESRNM